jgi:hypothetical protein
LLIGNGTNYTSATLTAGTNIAITNGSGSISIATSATPSFATSITTPIVYGGTTASSSLTLQSTSGVGTSDSILFKVGNNGATTAMTVDTSGNVGIGGTPSTKLTLFGTQTVRGSGTDAGIYTCLYMDEFTAPYTSVLAGYTLSLNTGGNSARTARLYVDQNGNVGIGTGTTPASTKLEIAGNVSAQQSNGRYFGFGVGGFSFDGTTVNDYGITYTTISSTYNTVLAAFSNIKFATSQTERMRIDSSGNVGIGTSSPKGKLDSTTGDNSKGLIVSGATNLLRVYPYYNFGGNNRGTTLESTNVAETAYGDLSLSGNTIQFLQGVGTERMRIDSSGKVGIGTSSPLGSFQVVGSAISNPVASVFSTASGDTAYQATLISKYDNDTTTSQVFIRFAVNNNGATSGQINANGANSAAFGTWSDERLKDNIVNLPSQLANICALRPVEFDYKDGSGHQIGFVAQEMKTVYPDAVGTGTDDMLTLTGWSKTEARLVAAIQELEARLAKLENVQ